MAYIDVGQSRADVPAAPRWSMAKSEANALTECYSVPPVPVVEIAESNGVDVVFADFAEHRDSVAGFCDFRAAKLFVNKADLIERQYFTVAHEFSHWIMHREVYLNNPDLYPVLPRFQKADWDDPLEKEANHFAANLLVPERLLRPVISAPVARLAGIFKVSRAMMEYRVQNVR